MRYTDKLKIAVLTSFSRRDASLFSEVPLISFTFDDFPRSALTVGGSILRTYEARGTYYVASGLMNIVNVQGVHFSEDDLKLLLVEGHELGTHTYSHVSSCSVTLKKYIGDVIKANSFVEQVVNETCKLNFCYPFGHVTLAAKQKIGELHSSCRSTLCGINQGRIDLNLLRANNLYSSTTDLGTVTELIRMNSEIGGWLIFYTHDVRDKPSPYGCTPHFFAQVVKQAVKSGARILTVAAALKEIQGNSPLHARFGDGRLLKDPEVGKMNTEATESARLANSPEHDGLAYVLITPARNEAAYIELTLASMVRQTVPPLKWVIVSDGSMDGTDEIVKKYTERYAWIELVRMPERAERHFAGKVYAFNAGYERVKGLEYDIIGNLDADISFGNDYFSFLLSRFAANSRLGVGGTPFREGTTQYDYRFTSSHHVSGACQLFRRECFEEIGGYIPIQAGGIDWTAVTTARMKGWSTRTFTEKTCIHHRKIGTGKSSPLVARFRFGKQDYYLGGHPLWEVFRSLYHMKDKPYIVGGLFLLSGYLWGFLCRVERPISAELVAFRRKEQMQRLRDICNAYFSARKVPTIRDRTSVDSVDARR